MKQRATVQRIAWKGNTPSTQHLVANANGWEWQDYASKAFVFPDFLAPLDCTAGHRCELHAECVGRALGGHPVRLQREVNEERAAAVAAKSAPVPAEKREPQTNAERVAINREGRKKTQHDPAEVFEETERRLGEREG